MSKKEIELQWKRIAKGDELPCQSFLRKKNGEILKLSTGAGVTVGQDAYYLPVDEVIEEIKNYPIEESEDEKIKQELIEYHKAQAFLDGNPNNKHVKYVAWLEKQGEQKPVDKVEPKFKVGDWVVDNNGRTGRIIECTKDFADVDLEFSCLLTRVHNIRSWTIQDAKDGDVVVDKSDGTIGIFQSIGHHPDGGSYNDPSYCFLHCHCDDEFFYADFEHGNEIDSDDLVPATKEQRDILFSKMKEAGYEWDAEKKELKKIEQNIAEWSEEDKMMLQYAIEHFERQKRNSIKNGGRRKVMQDFIDWLESLKDRVLSRSNWKPSDKQMELLREVQQALLGKDCHNRFVDFMYELKRLREE